MIGHLGSDIERLVVREKKVIQRVHVERGKDLKLTCMCLASKPPSPTLSMTRTASLVTDFPPYSHSPPPHTHIHKPTTSLSSSDFSPTKVVLDIDKMLSDHTHHDSSPLRRAPGSPYEVAQQPNMECL